MTDPPLVADGLIKEYGEARALGPIDLAVRPGELVALIGHNGAGKSTLLGLAAGLLDRSQGTLTVCGERPGSMAARRLVSFVPDVPVLYEDLGIGELADYVARMHGVPDPEDHVDEVLERLGLEDRADQLPPQLSRGLRQRAALLMGFVRPFSLLLLDEPFAPLDTASARAVADLVAEHVAAGAAAIVASHQLDLLQGARCITLRDGLIE